jgi:hypothetical protein
MTLWKRKNYGDNKKIGVIREKWPESRVEEILRKLKLMCMTL